MNALPSPASPAVYLLANDNLEPARKLRRYFSLVQQFREQGDFLTYDEHADWLACYEKDAQSLKTLRPLLVFRPHSTAIIGAFLQACYVEKIPLTVRSGGTSLNGSSVCSQEGIILLTGHLKRILEYDIGKGIIVVEPGVTVAQLNHKAVSEGWEFPLEMATQGVAGLGGCLSSRAKGYDQGAHPLYQSIRSVWLVDGQGQTMQVPGSLVCGAEGILGVIIRIEIQLARRPAIRLNYAVPLTLEESLAYLPQLRLYQSLKKLFWQNSQLYLSLEGEEWRVAAAAQALKSLMDAHSLIENKKMDFAGQYAKNTSQITLSSALPVEFLLKGKSFIVQSTAEQSLKNQIGIDILAGNIHLQLSSSDDFHPFKAKFEKWMIRWVEFLEEAGGSLVSGYGIGKIGSPYLPPFLSENEANFWRHFQSAFDPNRILSKDRFFPEEGKCLIRISEPLQNEEA